MLAHPTLEQLHALGLHGLAKGFKELEHKAEARGLDHAEWLADTCTGARGRNFLLGVRRGHRRDTSPTLVLWARVHERTLPAGQPARLA